MKSLLFTLYCHIIMLLLFIIIIIKGDSGGPLVREAFGQTYLLGIFTLSTQPCDPFHHPPSIFTNVNAYLAWIMNNMSWKHDFHVCMHFWMSITNKKTKKVTFITLLMFLYWNTISIWVIFWNTNYYVENWWWPLEMLVKIVLQYKLEQIFQYKDLHNIWHNRNNFYCLFSSSTKFAKVETWNNINILTS